MGSCGGSYWEGPRCSLFGRLLFVMGFSFSVCCFSSSAPAHNPNSNHSTGAVTKPSSLSPTPTPTRPSSASWRELPFQPAVTLAAGHMCSSALVNCLDSPRDTYSLCSWESHCIYYTFVVDYFGTYLHVLNNMFVLLTTDFFPSWALPIGTLLFKTRVLFSFPPPCPIPSLFLILCCYILLLVSLIFSDDHD